MQSSRAYKSFIGRMANKKRTEKYSKPKEDTETKGLLAKRDAKSGKSEASMDDILAEYISVVKKVIGAKDAE